MPSAPCPDCFSGSLHNGTPTGSVQVVHGLNTYVVVPDLETAPKGVVVMIPDAFGWTMVNNKLLCDAYAKKGGYIVYLPDFMNGRALPPSALDLMKNITTPASWFTTIFLKPFYILKAIAVCAPPMIAIRASVTRPRVVSFFQSLRTSEPPFTTSSLKIAAAGFCWGGQHAVFLAQDTPSTRVVRHASQTLGGPNAKIQSLIDCAFTAHPSMLSVPKDIEAVVLPLSVAVGEVDMALGAKEVAKMHDILENKKKGDHECVILPGAKHGFAVRSDEEDKLQMEYADKAEVQALQWFEKWFA